MEKTIVRTILQAPAWASPSERSPAPGPSSSCEDVGAPQHPTQVGQGADAFMRALPFMRQLPPGLFNSLDTSTFCLPVGESARLRAALEQELAAHVMTYHAASFASEAQKGLQLCRLLKPARLSPEQLEWLQKAEARCRNGGIVLVAYEKPLQIK